METHLLRSICNFEEAICGIPKMTMLDFSQPFILDVDWFIREVGAILSQKIERQKQVIAYANKGLSLVQKHLHPMEGECYALVWGIMHF